MTSGGNNFNVFPANQLTKCRANKSPLGTEVGLSPGHILLDGDPAPPTEAQQPLPNVSPHVYCGQTVAHLSNY